MSKISVIIPLYNVEKYLERCLKSILSQTFQDFDVILIDDGSSDNSGSMCDEYSKKYDIINVIHQKNSGQAVARNKGLDWCFENSDSQWITFIDSDDWVHKQYLEALINSAENSDIDVSVCDFVRVSECKSDEVFYEDFNSFNVFSSEFVLNNVLNSIVPWGKLYRKSCFDNLRYPIGMKHEDEFITYKILLNNSRVNFINKKMYYYFTNVNSVSYSQWTPDELNTIKAFDEKLVYLKNKNLSELYEWQLEHYMYFLCDCCKNIIENPDYKKLYLSKTRKKLKLIIKEFERTTGRKLDNQKEWVYDIAYPLKREMYWKIKGITRKLKN